MTGAGLMLPLPATIAAAESHGGPAIDNVLTPDPREAFVAGGAFAITLDLGAIVAVDTFFIGYTDAVGGLAWSASVPGGAVVASGGFLTSYRRAPMRHAATVLNQPIMTQYLTFSAAGPMTIGVVAAGLSIRADYEWGGGRPISDTGRADRLATGFGIERGVTAGGWSWTFAGVDDDTAERLYALALDAGTTETVLAFEDAASIRNEAWHWGTLTRLEPYSRQAPGENKWAMQVQEW